MRLLHRLGIHHARGDVVVADFDIDHVLGPEALQDIEILIHDLAALLERHADGVELAPVPARRHAHEQPAVREKVHARKLLGEDDGIAHRQHQDAGAELDPAGARGDGGQQRERLDNGKIRIDPKQDVIPHPKRVEAELLHSDPVFDQRLDIRHLRIGGEVLHRYAERASQTSHRRNSFSPRRDGQNRLLCP